MRAEDHGIIKPLNINISYAPSSLSVFVHFLLLDYVQQVIVFPSNVPQVENILSENII